MTARPAAARVDQIVGPVEAIGDPAAMGHGPTARSLAPTARGRIAATGTSSLETTALAEGTIAPVTETSAMAIARSGRRSREGPIADRGVTGATDNGRPNTVARVGEADRHRLPAARTASAIGSRVTNAREAEATDNLSGLRRPGAVSRASALDAARGRVVPPVGSAPRGRVGSVADARIVARGRNVRRVIGRATDRRTNVQTARAGDRPMNAPTGPAADPPTNAQTGRGPIGVHGTSSLRATNSPRARKGFRVTDRPRPKHPRATIKSSS